MDNGTDSTRQMTLPHVPYDQGHPVDSLADAVSRAQGSMGSPRFDAINPHFGNKFASLASIRNVVVPALAAQGVAVFQELTSDAESVSVTTTLHRGVERLSFGPFRMPLAKRDAHGIGSAATYAKRYHLQSVLCVVGEDDDDGNAAADKPARGPEVKAGDSPKVKTEKGPKKPTKAEAAQAQTTEALSIIEAQATRDGLEAVKPQLMKLQPACGDGWKDVVSAWGARAKALATKTEEA